MTTSDPTGPETAKKSTASQPDLRTQRGVRFSDSEWELVKTTGLNDKIPAAEFVHNATLSAIAAPADKDSAALPPGILEIIRHTYRSTYILSTLKRDELVQDGRHHKLDDVIRLARKAEAELLSSA